MSSIIFGYTMSLATAATPSTGFLVAYDSDGIIKQKDSAGVITPIGGGPSPGLMGTFSLAQVLAYSNDSEVYSILMGTATSILVGNSGSIDMASASTIYMGTASSILSNNGLSAFYLDYNTATSSVYLTNGYNYLSIDNATMSLINNLSGAIDISNGTNYVKLSTFNEIFSTSEIRLRVYNASNEIMIKTNIGSSASSPNSLSNAIFIGTQNSTFDSNVTNSVILGGYGQQAIASDSVYVPDIYIQSGKRLRGSLGNGSVNFTDTNDIIIENSQSTLALITSSSSTILSTNGIIIADTLTQISSPNIAASPVFISTRDSVITEGVHNTVIIGGENLIASLTNSVVLGEFVNINNSYTLPSVDGASGSYLVTDGTGNVSWQMTPPEVQDLENVLSIGNNTGFNSIEMGTGSSIYSIRGGGQINLDFAPDSVVISTDNGSLSKAYIQLDDEDIIIDTNENLNISAGTASVIVGNGEGLVYGFDYSATFVTYSLVTKGYVDAIVNSVGAENGLVEITSGTFGLGGTISQDTTINGNGYTFSLSSFNKLRFTASQTNTQFSSLNLGDGFILSTSDGIQSNYLQSSNLSDISIVNIDSSGTSSVVEAGTSGPNMNIYDGASQSRIQIYTFDNTIGSGDGSSNNRMVITDEFASKGLVYYDDYSANFTTYSLVTKDYVDAQVATSTSKYSEIRSFTASVTETINHNLGTDEIIVQAYESTGIMAIPGTVQINGSNDVDITFSKTLSNIKIVIIG